MDYQPIFDRMVDLMILQGEPSIALLSRTPAPNHTEVEKKKKCLYNSPRGAQCAVGCLFPYGTIPEHLNHAAVSNPALAPYIGPIFGKRIPDFDDLTFLMRMQKAHDGAGAEKAGKDWTIEFLEGAIYAGGTLGLNVSFAQEARAELEALS